jgi:hypothetical protein
MEIDMTITVSEIYSFCIKHGITTTRFCRDAAGDGHYLTAISEGRKITPSKEKEMRRYMAWYERRVANGEHTKAHADREHGFTDGSVGNTHKSFQIGSADLCKAIFATGKTHGPIKGVTV